MSASHVFWIVHPSIYHRIGILGMRTFEGGPRKGQWPTRGLARITNHESRSTGHGPQTTSTNHEARQATGLVPQVTIHKSRITKLESRNSNPGGGGRITNHGTLIRAQGSWWGRSSNHGSRNSNQDPGVEGGITNRESRITEHEIQIRAQGEWGRGGRITNHESRSTVHDPRTTAVLAGSPGLNGWLAGWGAAS